MRLSSTKVIAPDVAIMLVGAKRDKPAVKASYTAEPSENLCLSENAKFLHIKAVISSNAAHSSLAVGRHENMALPLSHPTERFQEKEE